ncbi:MAG: hypothetical protein ACI9H6_000480 [Patiriisocius sp.]|jgi:hypothetical protein
MKVLIAVVDDLFQFVRTALFGAVAYAPGAQQVLDTYQEKLARIQGVAAPAPKAVPAKNSDVADPQFRVGDQYFVGSIGVFLYDDPVLAFDNALTRLHYGQQVRLLKLQGRWAMVRSNELEGWVFTQALQNQAIDVYPRFMEGVTYTADHSETTKLRACIDDHFGGARGEHPLSPSEYVHYRLQQKKRVISWEGVRMRIPGTWARKLRGKIGIHSGIVPKTESVMEYVVDDIGHLAFVEAVFPDGSIKVTEIGKHEPMLFTEEILTTDQYKELRPVFIAIN